MNDLTVEEILAAFRDADEGKVELWAEDVSWDDVYAGNVTFATSSGWRFVVFNDCMEWDYVDSVIAPDGRTAGIVDKRFAPSELEDWFGGMAQVADWEPANLQRWETAPVKKTEQRDDVRGDHGSRESGVPASR